MAALCPDEGAFGPVSSCRHMDFTLGFQYRFMSIVPSVILIAYSATRLKSLVQAHQVTKNVVDILSAFKLALGLTLFAATAACIALVPRTGWGYWATAAFSLELVTSLCVASLSYLHHTRECAPSSLIGIYSFLSSLFAATQLRTYVLSSLLHAPFFPAFVVAFSARACLIIAEFANKRRFLRDTEKPVALEITASLPERLLFVYLYPLLLRGFKGSINLDQLNEFGLPPVMSSGPANRKLSKTLKQSHQANPSVRQPIFMPSILAFAPQFFVPALPKLMLIAATFTQPYLVQAMLSFIDSYSDSEATPEDPSHGWGLVGAYAIVYFIIAACTALYWDKVYTMVVCYRAALVSVIFDKSMRLSASVSESKGGTAVTYMSVDVERVCEGIAFFHETWSALLSIAVAAVVLWFKATFAMIPPICIMVMFFMITSYIGKRVAKAQKRWMESTQARVKVLTSITSQMIPLKFLGVESAVPKWVEPVRNREIEQLRRFYLRLVIVGVLSQATVNFAGISALGTYVGITDEELRPATLFTILTTLNLVTLPISTVGNCFPLLLASYASMKRIAEFLSLGEKSVVHSGSVEEKSDSDFSEKDGSSLHKSDIGDPLSLSHATVAVSEGGKPLLSDFSVSFLSNALNVVVGPVAAGKTVLLRTLLGETFVTSGVCVRPEGRVAYAPQEAFVWPTTVRENIILDNAFEPEWYATVVQACSLEEDFLQMANGDTTVMTSGSGSSVSGGQKQRISLARAVYARSEITLLDDCFSALDAHTAASVFSGLFSPTGLLHGKSVLLVTHNLLYLSSAARIIILDSCTVVAQGSLQELRDSNLDVARYVGEEHYAVEDNQVKEEKDAPKVSKWAPYIFYIRACGWQRLTLCLTCLVTYTAMQIGLQVLLKYWSESTSTSHGPWLGGYAAFTVTCFIASFTTLYVYAQKTATHASLVIHARQLAAVLAAPVTYFQRTPVAQLQNRWSSDMFIVDFAFPRAVQDLMFTAVYVVGAIVLILIAVPWLAISIPFLAVIYYCLQRVYLATSRQLQQLTMSSKTPIYTAFTSTLTGLVTIRAFRAEKLFKDMSLHHLDRAQVPMYYRYAGIRFLRTSLNFLTAFLAVAIAALAVGLRTSTSGGYLGVALSQLVGLSQTLINLLLAYTRVENGLVSIERIFELDRLESEGGDDSLTKAPSPEWPSQGAIEFRNVNLRYGDDLPPVLKNLSFSLKGGEKLGICGRTGSGKSSTVFALLNGLGRSELCTGSILIDGVDIRTIPIATLRSAISTVSQAPFLLYTSMRDNLTLGCASDVTDDQIWDALKLVGMDTSVGALESKLDTVIQADGSEFSAGERQLLCIARVLLQKRKIVVLDEASSSMDSTTDKRLLDVLSTNLRDVTVISVAHRISTIVDYDQVMVMDNGSVVESGAPATLLKTSDSLFGALYEKQ
ncbi:P-loop containing nucleoside triphosphate hydrolase protein [Hymenopellis radicata]|nr:P-loop containing nucleoside triphosphate hydrolase protein [Hymenopellis radicata]